MHVTWNLATKITAVYLVVSAGWIYFTDRLLKIIATTPEEITALATYKGLLFVTTTAGLLYLLILAFSRKQCNRCHSIQETVNDAILIFNSSTGAILDVNRKACEMFGLTREEYFHDWPDPASADGSPDIRSVAGEWFHNSLTETPRRFEWQTVRKDGTAVWVDITLKKAMINGTERRIAVARDITARKRAEGSLHETNRTLRMLLKCNEVLIRAAQEAELLQDICAIVVEEGGYRCAWVGLAENDFKGNIRPAAQAGFLPESAAVTDITEVNNERGQGPTGTAVRTGAPCLVRDVRTDSRYAPWREAALATGYLSSLSVPLVSSGRVLGALTVGASDADAFDDEEIKLMSQLAGDLAYGIMSLRTAAQQRRIEQELVSSERNLAEAQTIAMLGSWEYDMEKDEEHRSDEFFRILGIAPINGGRAHDSIFDYIHPDDKDFVMKKIVETLEKGKPYDVEYRIIRPDGAVRVIHARGKTLENSDGKKTRFLGTALDITERKQTEDALRNSELRFRSLVEATTDWIWEIDANNRYVYSSPKSRDLLGNDSGEIIGRTPFDLLHEGAALSLKRSLRDIVTERKPFFGLEMETCANGVVVTIETSGVPIYDENGAFNGYRGISRDVTERKKLEQKYLQAQKMEAVGQLAGGIAHDFNNILTAIIGFEHLLQERLNDEKSLHFAKQVSMLAEKASHLTRDLLAFSRKQPMNPKPIDLNMNIQNLGKILQRLIGEDVELRSILQEGAMPVLAVSGHLEQVFMNMATNARDAMPDGGLLTIKTETAFIDNDFVKMNGYGAPGRYALVSVSDNGCGMDEETRLKVFEPFFTTKEVGKGTGLGLSTAYGIIRQHGGFLSVYSEPGEGSTFRIYLPVLEEEAGLERDPADLLLPPPGRETVLLVEDEPEVREMTRTLLEKHGYQVITAIDGEHALEVFAEHEEKVELLILDVIMPKRNGKEIYDCISRCREDIKTIFISGYTADIVEQKGIPENCHLVSKPFSPHAFLWKVRNVLDEGNDTVAGAVSGHSRNASF
jgi:PAS domain S-box-containing protein